MSIWPFGNKDKEPARKKRPKGYYEISEDVWPQLMQLDLDPDVPLVAVDADEVLVDFAAHMAEYFQTIGYSMVLNEYRLDGNIINIETGEPASKEEGWALINRFFADQALHQKALSGAVDGMAALAHKAQVIILTNIPIESREKRIQNLAALGMGYPLIANTGGKGRVLRYLWDYSNAPIAFIDDSPSQITSARKRAPGVFRSHYCGSAALRAIMPDVPDADAYPNVWADNVDYILNHFEERC